MLTQVETIILRITLLAGSLRRDDRGQDLVEYALIVAAVGLALITTVNQLTTAVVSLYSSITQGLASIGASGA
jgi:Flp pilus assembly pilin Flp